MMTTAHEVLYIDDDDVFANTSCLFQKYDGSSMSCGSSSSSRSSKSSKGSTGYENGCISAGRTFRTHQDGSDIDKESPRNTKDTNTERRNSVRSYKKLSRSSHDSPIDTTQYKHRLVPTCDKCASPLEDQQTRYQSRLLSPTACSSCSDTNYNKRHASISPAYQQGSWKRRLRAERSTDIDLSPLLDVLERIDRIDTSMGIPMSAYESRNPANLNDNDVSAYRKSGVRNINISRMESKDANINDKDMTKFTIDNRDMHTPKDLNRNVTDMCNIRKNKIDTYDRKSKQSISCVNTDNATHLADEMNANSYPETNSPIEITTNDVTRKKCLTEDKVTANSTYSSMQDREDEKETKLVESDVEFENLFKEAQSFTKQLPNNTPNRSDDSRSLTYQKGRRRSSASSNQSPNKHKSVHQRNEPSERKRKGCSSSTMSTEDSTSNSLDKQTSDTDNELFKFQARRNSKRRLSKGQLELRMRTEIKNMNTHISLKQDENQVYGKKDVQVERISSTDSDLSGQKRSPSGYTANKNQGDKLRESKESEYSQFDIGVAKTSSKHTKQRSSVSKLNRRGSREVDKDLHNLGKDRFISDYKQELSDSKKPSINIENIPCSYEEFNEDLEKQSVFEDNKRSSIRPEESMMDFTSSTDETLNEIHKSSNNRRNSVSKMKMFWEQQLGSASKVQKATGQDELKRESIEGTKDHIKIDDSTHGKREVANNAKTLNNVWSGNIKVQPMSSCEVRKHSGPLSDEDETFCMIQNKLRDLPRTSTQKNLKQMSSTNSTESGCRFVNENYCSEADDVARDMIPGKDQSMFIQKGEMKTVASYILKKGATTSQESATDEDERFRRIQSKIMSRQTVRRKSILKNKDVTSSFLNEFLTVPASRTRVTDSESGCSSPSDINQSQLSKRRVSFQQTYVSSSSSSSDSLDSSYDDDEGDAELATNCTIVSGTDGHSETCDNASFAERGVVNVVKENAENEHLAWRNECGDLRKTGKNTNQDSICKNLSGEDKPSKSRNTTNNVPKTHDKNIIASNNGIENVKIQTRNMPFHCERELLVDKDTNCYSNKKQLLHRDDKTHSIRSKTSNACNVKQKQDRLLQNTSECDLIFNAKSVSKADKDSTTLNTENKQGSVQIKLFSCEESDGKSKGKTLDDTYETLSKSLNRKEGEPRRRRKANLFTVAGDETEPDETTHLLNLPVELDSSDSSDVELSWRTRGYNADFYMSRKSITGSELIQKFKEVVRRKRSKDGARVTK